MNLAPCAPHRTRVCGFLYVASILALPPTIATALTPLGLEFISQAQAQQPPGEATQALFLAVDRNDLEQVRAAITKGADIQARDFTGTQPVDIAIDRGYFDIAHYLISVRNAAQAKQNGTPASPTPSAEDLAQTQSLFKAPSSVATQAPDPSPPEAPAQTDLAANPFETDAVPQAVVSPPAPPVAPSSVEIALSEAPPPEAPLPENVLDRATDDPFAYEAQPQSPAQAPVAGPSPAPTAPDIAAPVPTPALAPEPTPIPTPIPAPAKPVEAIAADKSSATKRFITTFLDFFKPPDITGVTRRESDRAQPETGLSEQELAQQLHEIEAERGDAAIKGPEVPISPEELAQELPPSPTFENMPPDELAAMSANTPELPAYAVSSPRTGSAPPTVEPMPAAEDAFGNMEIKDATAEDEQPLEASSSTATPDFKEAPGVPGKRYDPKKPFGGGVDPEVLAFLGLDERTGEIPQQSEGVKGVPESDSATALNAAPQDPLENPFDTLEGTKAPELSDLLEGLSPPQEVASTPPKSPPSPDGATTSEDFPGIEMPSGSDAQQGDVNELAGLLESTGENVKGTNGWDVKKVEGADMPDEVAMLTDIEPTGQVLDGVELAIGEDTVIGQEVGADRMLLLQQKSIHKPCIAKDASDAIFCIDTVTWPFELSDDFLVDTIMYQGTRAIGRYDAGRATNFLTLFRSASLTKVLAYYTSRYGPPTQSIERAIAPLAAPRQANPTYLWQSREPGTDTITTLEIRKFDDAQSGFPDTKRGALLLYRAHAKSIFPQLSQLELMVLKADATAADNGESPTDPGNIWN